MRWTMAMSLALVLGACGDDTSFSPTIENVAGDYSASLFTLSLPVGPVNQLILGSEVTASLAPDGTMTGRFFVPHGGAGGADLDADLTGTWTLSGGAVTFDPAADTFIREMRFTVDRNRLTGTDTFGHQTLDLVLTKTE